MGRFYNLPPTPFLGGRQPYEGDRLLVQPGAAVVSSDNPPFGELYAIIDPWIVQPGLPQLGSRIAALLSTTALVSSDNPPPLRVWIAQAVITPPLPTLPSKLNPSLLDNTPAQVDNPPLKSVLAYYTALTPTLPTLANKLNPSLLDNTPAAQVDNPPLLRRQILLQAWEPQPLQIVETFVTLQDGPAPSAQVDNPPLTRRELSNILAAWQQVPPLPTLTLKAPLPTTETVTSDNAPGAPTSDIVITFEPDPLPQFRRGLNPAILNNIVTPDNPPVNRDRGLFASLFSWITRPGLPTLAPKLNPSALNVAPVTPDNPPGKLVKPELAAFAPVAPPPTLPGKLNPTLLDFQQTVDDPPGMSATDIVVRIKRRILPILPPKLNPALLNVVTVAADNPPLLRQSLATILQAWQPQPVTSQRQSKTPIAVDYIPPGVRVNFFAVAPVPLPTLQIKLNPSLLNVTAQVDNPPGKPVKPELAAFAPQPPLPTLTVRLNPSLLDVVVTADNPPLLRRTLIDILQAWWTPEPVQVVETFVTLQDGETPVTPPVTPPRRGVWWPFNETAEESERAWQESHGHLREKLRKAEREAAEAADATRDKKKKQALNEAADAVRDVIEYGEKLPDESLADLTRLLAAATAATRTAETIRNARRVSEMAQAALAAREQDEEEAIMLLLS